MFRKKNPAEYIGETRELYSLLVRFLLIDFFTLCKKIKYAGEAREVIYLSVRSWFGTNVELSRQVMDFVASPRELYNITWLSKATREAVTTEMVVWCSMHAGGRPYQCMQILNKLMKPKAVYPPSAL